MVAAGCLMYDSVHPARAACPRGGRRVDLDMPLASLTPAGRVPSESRQEQDPQAGDDQLQEGEDAGRAEGKVPARA